MPIAQRATTIHAWCLTAHRTGCLTPAGSQRVGVFGWAVGTVTTDARTGACTGLQNMNCDDGDPYCGQLCRGERVFVGVDGRAPCDDGDACTEQDQCTADGACEPLSVVYLTLWSSCRWNPCRIRRR